ncbi:hypothetical protein EKN56_07370 [Limnobaculum zhutongyuii]|uniref:Tle cognate immunity protein 4 C-terminal domain-containing protein n=1 Tax=Limnobaculum zhutongyuii TaxID=2498113 RepID=A0A411WJ87_9GAMM|nr:hypothetical protein [Limnobaculum zhutongyuii]QBH96236.1 hypothetical protein EKN56_07370 [Limnobaculum zhutongyuii]TQS87176.1 hypothetical protein ELQ32_15890 [Limnobaculum zhutongyuii]
MYPDGYAEKTDEKNLELTANYQLLNHPEVTFSFNESVVTREDYQSEANRDWIDLRLMIVGSHHSKDKKISLLGSPRYQDISLGGQKGVAVLSKYISYESEKPVYFYIARMISNDPEKSSLTFLARMDESKAKNTPLTVNEFELLVTNIVDSVERR